jgi:hypothetical protein
MSDPVPAIAIPPRRRRALVWMLRGIGILSLSALGAVFIPHAWMDAIHRAIGLGELPDLPVVEYLSRSLSLFYAWLGIVPLYAARDIERHLGLIRLFAASGLAVCVIQTAIDFAAPLPLWWTLAESGFLFAYFGSLWALAKR